ncbi:MAG: lactoylglutathione lyase [Arcticibacterium sp.]|jgi:lactoylglutathione lyase
MPKIQHVALYCQDLEVLRTFYVTYFGAKSNEKYENSKNGFASYFLSFEDGPELEIITKVDIESANELKGEFLGFTHLAFSVGSEEKVTELTERLRKEGHKIEGECRWTGDGFYESVILDPEGNRIEITI